MRVVMDAFSIPKLGNSQAENDDAFAPWSLPNDENGVMRFAVADGATECSYSKQWASALVKDAVSGRLVLSSCDGALPDLQAAWRAEIGTRDLPWFAIEKLNQGAFAALVTLELRDAENGARHGVWNAEAVGDSCLFQIRSNNPLPSFPLRKSADFNHRPFLIGTTTSPQAIKEHVGQPVSDRWESGDEFFLMTDALARWFLEQVESGGRPWIETRAIEDERAFVEWVHDLRENRGLRNDDTTLVRITLT